MTWLAFATLRTRKSAFIGAFVALFSAAALVCGCGLLLTTGILGSVAPERYAGAPVLVSGDQNVHQVETSGNGKSKIKSKPVTDRVWIPAALAGRLAAVPGVGSVATEVTFAAYLPGGRTEESWGHGWESAPLGDFTLASGRAPRASDEIVLDASTAKALHLTVGADIRVLTASGPLPCRVVGVTVQGTPDETAVFFSTAQAGALAGHSGLVSAIGVFPDAGASTETVAASVREALAAAGSTAGVHTGDDRGQVEFLSAANARVRLTSIGAVMASTALLVALLMVVGTFSLSVQQRQRELAMLRAVAATPRQIRKLIGGEALLVGVVAGVTGALAGLPLGEWLHSRFIAFGIMPLNLRLVLSPFPVFIAALATPAAAWAAARITARRVNKIRPVEALGEAELTPPRISGIRVLFGLLATAGALTLTLLLTVLHSDAATAPVSLVTTLLWCTVLGLLGPIITRLCVAVLSLPLRTSQIGGFLAAANLRSAAHRLASIVTPLALLIAMACTILFSHTTMDHAAAAQTSAGTKANYVVGPRVSDDVVTAVENVSGVRAVTQELHATVRTGLTEHTVLAVSPQGLADTLDLKVESGDMGELDPTTMAAAEGLGFHVGDRVALTLPDGVPVTLTVVALYGRGLGFGDFVLDRDLLAANVDVPLDDELLVSAPGVARDTLVAALKAAAEPGVAVTDQATATATAATSVSTDVGYTMLGLILTFTGIAVLNTLAMTVMQRSREFTALRLAGATRGQVLGMLRWESVATMLIGAALGSAIGIGVLIAYAQGMTGSGVPSIALSQYLAIIGGSAVLVAIATWLPARIALAKRA